MLATETKNIAETTQCIAAKTITVKIEAAMMSVDFARFVMICFDSLRVLLTS